MLLKGRNRLGPCFSIFEIRNMQFRLIHKSWVERPSNPVNEPDPEWRLGRNLYSLDGGQAPWIEREPVARPATIVGSSRCRSTVSRVGYKQLWSGPMSGTNLGERAVVIGSGIAGLLSARQLSPFFDELILLDRDRIPEGLSFPKTRSN